MRNTDRGAIALEYGKNDVPIISAKGEAEIAEIIIEEAKKQGITTFCLTVDKEGHDYMKSMMEDLSYEVLDDISSLPLRLPQLYKNLTSN